MILRSKSKFSFLPIRKLFCEKSEFPFDNPYDASFLMTAKQQDIISLRKIVNDRIQNNTVRLFFPVINNEFGSVHVFNQLERTSFTSGYNFTEGNIFLVSQIFCCSYYMPFPTYYYFLSYLSFFYCFIFSKAKLDLNSEVHSIRLENETEVSINLFNGSAKRLNIKDVSTWAVEENIVSDLKLDVIIYRLKIGSEGSFHRLVLKSTLTDSENKFDVNLEALYALMNPEVHRIEFSLAAE